MVCILSPGKNEVHPISCSPRVHCLLPALPGAFPTSLNFCVNAAGTPISQTLPCSMPVRTTLANDMAPAGPTVLSRSLQQINREILQDANLRERDLEPLCGKREVEARGSTP